MFYYYICVKFINLVLYTFLLQYEIVVLIKNQNNFKKKIYMTLLLNHNSLLYMINLLIFMMIILKIILTINYD